MHCPAFDSCALPPPTNHMDPLELYSEVQRQPDARGKSDRLVIIESEDCSLHWADL